MIERRIRDTPLDRSTRTIVVTGAGSGIGAATVSRFKSAGALVVGIDNIHANSAADFDISADVSREEEVAESFEAISKEAGAIDVLVVSAGISARGTVTSTPVDIEHAGSTSVPELPAKLIIDIVVEVPDSAVEEAYVPDLERGGYRLSIREPKWFEHRLFKGPDTTVNLHVFSAGCEEVRAMLRFRDHLRADDADRELYAQSKRELATREWTYLQQYADAKAAVIREILARAS
jgi:GrpB-like predicted nucleotidyltransferase (UPF0157 family)